MTSSHRIGLVSPTEKLPVEAPLGSGTMVFLATEPWARVGLKGGDAMESQWKLELGIYGLVLMSMDFRGGSRRKRA